MGDIYDDKAQMQDAAFAERVAASLRAPERAHPSFEKRLMEKVLVEGRVLYKTAATSPNSSWWRTEWIVRISPRGGVAIAAGIAALIAVSSVVGSRISARAPQAAIAAQAAAARDTVQVVRFVFVDSGAASVALVGDFNEWTKGSTQLKRSGAPGVWTVSVPLTPGRHEYAFIVNGSRWVADPLAVKSSDDFGTESSVIRIGSAGKSET
ncbi:MAG TPA: isoamylase early set domain-containing protein [Gemmatimonadaceae bacterium]|nr:isoamylase early set domain-containing protein [Gemmatimonadaceae bacterium]